VDVEICGKPSKIVETIEQLAWLIAALRPPSPEPFLSVSHVEFRITASIPETPYILCELFPLPLQSERNSFRQLGGCWIPLFQKSVLAWGFPVKHRIEGAGVELPFHLMATMAAIRYPLEFQGGIILKNKSETLFPIAKLSCGIQWHRIEGASTKKLLDTAKSFPQWYQTKSLGDLIASRTFLGLFSHAKVELGTGISDVRPSDVPLARNWIRVGEEIPLNLTLRLPWIASFGVTPKIILPKSQRTQITNNDIGYEQSLQRSRRTPVLLYDSGTRTGWLVPELSVILHLSLANVASLNSQLKSIKKLQYAKPSADGGSAALVAINSCDQVILWRKKEAENKEYKFMDVVMHYMALFENRKQEEELKRASYELSASLHLRGWDFVDLRENTYFFSPRSLAPPRMGAPPNWWGIGSEFQTLVIFGRNLSQPIVPDRSRISVCSSWASPPPNAELLVSTVFCLQELSRMYQSSLPDYKLTEELVWNRPQQSRLFEDCNGECNPIQKAWKLGPLSRIRHPFRRPNNPGALLKEGAVIFGKRKAVVEYIRANGPCHPLERLDLEPRPINISVPSLKVSNLFLPVCVILISVSLSYLWKLWIRITDSGDSLIPFARRLES
jgi:hypothetical protein